MSVLSKPWLICLFCLFSAGLTAQSQTGWDTAKPAVFDLRQQDIYRNNFSLSGNWYIFWNQLLKPGEAGKDSILHSFPALWADVNYNGHRLPSQGYASYKLTILLPKSRPSLALEIPDTYSAYSLYINNKLIARNGITGKTEQESKPFWSTQTVFIPQGDDTLHLLLQVSNFWHSKGGTYKSILIGNDRQLYLKRERDTAYDLLLTGCLFMGGMFFLGLYLFGKKDKAILYFSLFCILYSYRMIGSDLYVLHTLFPSLNWFFTIKMEYLSLYMAMVLFAQYTRYLYSEDVHPLLMKSIIAYCLLHSIIVLVTPAVFFPKLLHSFLVSMFLCLAYFFYVNISAARNKRNGSVYALLSSAVVILVTFEINLNYFGIIPATKPFVFAGYICFFFFQALALSHRFAFSFKQAAAQAQQGLKAKTEFLSTMSHEIRTPLNAVIGMTHLLLHNKPREDQKKDLDVLLFSANNLLSIVNNILDYNKIEEGKVHFEKISMDLQRIAQHIISGFKISAEEKGIHLILDTDADNSSRKLLGDPTRTSQVITNLVHNALKFTREGSVVLRIRKISEENGFATLLISVEDTGIGIPENKLQLIFERFTQADSSTSREFGGTGLGLAITKKILDMQGAKLEVESKVGKGSKFYFTQSFPIDLSATNTDAVPAYDHTLNLDLLKGVSILLVEDNPLNVLVAQTILENEGAIIEVASNGQEALDIFNHNKHELILMDLQMPVMDGYKATGLLRGKGETLPIIALTANTPQEVEDQAFAAGLTDIVVKPFNPEDLYRVILRYVQPTVA